MRRTANILPAVCAIALLLCSGAFAQQASWVAPRAGAWTVEGLDTGGTHWQARLRITKRTLAARSVRIGGYFDWSSPDVNDAGREYVKGTFSRSTGRLTLHGYAVKIKTGEIMKAGYSASIKDHGKTIYRGKWFGNDVEKGKWSARWNRSR